MKPLLKGRLVARLARDAADLARAQALRHLCFHGRAGLDRDPFDSLCDHVLIEAEGRLLGCYRLMHLPDAAALAGCYSAQSYDLTALSAMAFPMLELGRFCSAAPDLDGDVLRLAWAALARQVDALDARALIGCTSFAGTDPAPHGAGLALLAAHVGPAHLAPARRAAEVIRLADLPAADPRQAARDLPPLLRSYLGLGGWVSDHAVIDRAMNTLHVFTAVEIAAIPPGRARALRALASD